MKIQHLYSGGFYIDEGELYERLPRFIPYFSLPLGTFLLTLRFIQLTWKILIGDADRMIASHEAEEALTKQNKPELGA